MRRGWDGCRGRVSRELVWCWRAAAVCGDEECCNKVGVLGVEMGVLGVGECCEGGMPQVAEAHS